MILDAANKTNLFIDNNACRSGICGSCRVKLLSGHVDMAVLDALTEQEKANGYILACQAKIRADVTVDAGTARVARTDGRHICRPMTSRLCRGEAD